MKSYHALAWKELSAQKITSILILTAVILSTMLTAAVGQSAGVLAAMREQQAITIGGDRHASFVQLDGEQVKTLQDDPRLSYVGLSVSLGSMDLNDLLNLDLAEYWNGAIAVRPAYSRLKEGRLPEKAMEIALPEDVLQLLGFQGKTGDTITLSLSKALRHGVVTDAYDYTADFLLTGITESNYLGYTGGHTMGIAGEGTAAEVLPPEYLYCNADIRVTDKGSFQSIIDDLCEKLKLHELDTLYNVPYLNALGIRYNAKAADSEASVDDAGFSYMTAVGILVVTLILLAAGLVIYNVLKIAAAQRVKQYGTLRAVGAEKGQLYITAAEEVLLLCAAGIPTGVLLGYLSAKGILTAALNQFSPKMFLAQDSEQLYELIAANSSGKWGVLLLSAAIALLSAFLAAVPAARFAANTPPAAAMSATNTKVSRKRRRTKKIRNFERWYARLNLSRSRGRTAITVLSLVMSITVFITLQSLLPLISTAGAESEHLGDYSVVNQLTGFSPEELARLAENEAVTEIPAQQFSQYNIDEQYFPIGIETDVRLGVGEIFQVFGFNDLWADNALAERLTPEQLELLKAGEACVVRNPIEMEIEGITFGGIHVETGQTITVSGKKLPVLLALSGYDGYFSVGSSGFIQGVQVLVTDRLYPELTGKTEYAEIRPVLTQDADRSAFDQVLDQLCRRLPGTTYVSYEQTDRQLAESEAQIKLLAWGLILFIALIGVLNIINTVYTNIHTRVREIGTQRAIGMSAGSLYRTFMWEGAYYGIFAAVIGGIAGWICTILVVSAIENTFTLAFPPLLAIAEAAGVSIAACLLASAVPLRKITELSIVDAVEAAE